MMSLVFQRSIRSELALLVLLLVARFVPTGAALAGTTIVYVTVAGVGNQSGDSWANATANLKVA